MERAYRKKPVVVEAVQWTGENHAEMCEFIDPEVFEIKPKEGLIIHTLEGDHHASPGDYIIKGVNGEFYPCKPDIFAKTYESAALTPQNEAPPNDPLTIDQLREMDGEPVWIKRLKGLSVCDTGWAVVDVCPNQIRVWWFGSEVEDEPSEKDYGETWLAYRRRRRGGEDT